MNPKIQAEIERAAKEYVDLECYAMEGDGPHTDTFKAGAKFGFALATKMHENLVTALEIYAITNEAFPQYGTVAREVLAKHKENLGE